MISRSQYLSGKVRRWHTHHSMDQTNADHSWGVAVILILIHPNPTANLIRAALLHDCGELLTGDVPGYAKANSLQLKGLVDQLEKDALNSLGLALPELSDEDKSWLGLADAVEAILFIRHCTNATEQDLMEYFPVLLTKAQAHADELGLDLHSIIGGTPR